ncbi:ABC transporter permease [Escherichia coli]|nr:ABC transporter permease [Escherichia coli]TIZ03597.1 ABC transporter permease [Escherichia coli]
MRHLRNIFNLGIKELRSLLGDKAMLTLIVFSFTVSVYSSATVTPGSLNLAPIAIADMDQSQLSNRIVNSFYRPWFLPPEMITADEMDAGLDAGRYTFAINIPPNFQRDVLAGRQPDIQVNVDATRMSQAFTGNGYIQNIINGEVNSFVARYRDNSEPLVSLETRMRFNPNLDPAWFGGVMAIINNITMLAIVLTGSALIREREHGTVEHLLVMPITPFEIMMAKVWSMGLVVLVVSGLSLVLMVKGVLGVPIEGSIPLFMLGVALSLFATTSIGIFMGTIARSMPQLGLLVILVLLPLQMLSGGSTPRESMPQMVQDIMLTMPTTHFVSLAQAILYRGAGFEIVWPQFLTLIVFSFTVSVYSSATVTPGSLNLAPIAIADMDQSQLSNRIVNSFYRPWFLPPEMITADEMDAGLDAGRYTFAINIPPNFQRDVLAGRQPDIQVNVDATRMSQAFTGNGYIQNIINGEVNSFVARYRDNSEPLVSLETRMRFNPNLDPAWFGGVMAIINNITMLAIVLTGSALIREREHGTVEHLLVMPITPFEIMMAKVWSMGLVVLVVSGLSLVLMVKGVLGVPIEGSIPLFMLGVALSLFATTSIGIFMGTIARSMPQLGLLVILVLLPLQMLSGGSTPRESMPQMVQDIMLTMPTTHFVSLAQAILYRGAGFEIVWPQFLTLMAIGGAFFTIALLRFRKTIGTMA